MNTAAVHSSSGNPPVCILVVDDHPNSAATLARVISQLGPGLEVLSAESADQAIYLIRERAVDMLITDLVMPGKTGLELIEKMQVLPNNRPAYTILMTAYDIPNLKEIARSLMVNEVVTKPFQPEDINRLITRAIDICGYAPIRRSNTVSELNDIPVSDGESSLKDPSLKLKLKGAERIGSDPGMAKNNWTPSK